MYLAEDPPSAVNIISDHNVLNQSTLLNAALSCKTFLHSTLNILWWSIDNIINLLLLLPAFKEFFFFFFCFVLFDNLYTAVSRYMYGLASNYQLH